MRLEEYQNLCKVRFYTKSLSNVNEWRQEETPDATVTVLSGVTT